MTLQEELQKLGLSEKAAKTYLAALEVGSSPVQTIAQKANLSRTTVYPQIEELIKLGLMTTVERGKKTFYNAEAPRQLDLLLKKQEDEITAKREELIKKIPEFDAIYSLATDKPSVKYYEGSEGLASMREELLQNPRYISFLSFTAMDDYLAGLPNFENEQSERRANQHIPIKVIYTYSKGKYPWAEGKMREVKFLPFDRFPFSASVSICPDVGIQVAKYRDGYVGVIIENTELAQTLSSVFNLCWEMAEKQN